LSFRTLDLNLLRVFDAVMAERNLTRAADQLAMTQPAVSNALRRLRDSVGEPLFTRAPYGVKPTARAEALWPVVQQALHALRSEFAPEHYDPLTQDHTFLLAMADATSAVLLPPLLRELGRSRARATVRVIPLATRDPSDTLERAHADMAVGHFPDLVMRLERAQRAGEHLPLRAECLYRSEYVCVMRREHPLAQQPLTLEAYCAAEHLLVSFSGRGQGLVDDALAAMGRSRRLALTVNQFFTAGQVVAQTDLLTVLPRSFLPVTGVAEGLAVRDLPVPLAPLQVHLLWHRRHDRDPAHLWMREQVAVQARATMPT
jgi:DNA-binding transcriptional LysR family regulator